MNKVRLHAYVSICHRCLSSPKWSLLHRETKCRLDDALKNTSIPYARMTPGFHRNVTLAPYFYFCVFCLILPSKLYPASDKLPTGIDRTNQMHFNLIHLDLFTIVGKSMGITMCSRKIIAFHQLLHKADHPTPNNDSTPGIKLLQPRADKY